ncbi:MAG TPA: acyltransferase family protein [Candidatus Dormibacteraeota bacterium]|nr:acyltransferase family protein [Candidatus Dormibacteraeota bacterium]
MSSERIHYLDWLKVLIVYGIVLFHVSLVFSFGTWLVSNHERSIVLSAFAGFCFPWGIPAMFLIAGADAWFGLHSRSVADFLRRRFLRLVVPLVPGLLVLSPLQRFVTSSNPPPSIDTFWDFYASFFRSFHFSWTLQFISQYWLHLWFLAYLFAITLVCAPVLVWLRKPAGRRLTSWLVALACRRGGVLVLAAPLVLSQLALRPRFPAYQDWADVATYTLAFLWGAILFSDRRFEAAIREQVRWLLAAGTVTMLGIGLLTYFTRIHATGDTGAQAAAQLAQSFLWSLFVWSWLLAVLYLGIRWLNFPNRMQRYAEESVLPVYVIHHPVVLLIASFVVTWNLGVWPKFALILVSVAVLTLGIYEFGVRRWRATRLMFGLNPVPAPSIRSSQPASRPQPV